SVEPDPDGEALWVCKVFVRGWAEPVVVYAEAQEAARLAAWHGAARAQHQ
ncbi:MAG: hypothetical protein GX558_09070, partial [Clostridiales bacterium]|nr:hypothetical protein [Clostridiales bacterium]